MLTIILLFTPNIFINYKYIRYIIRIIIIIIYCNDNELDLVIMTELVINIINYINKLYINIHVKYYKIKIK